MKRKLFILGLVLMFACSTFALAEELPQPTEDPVLVEEPADTPDLQKMRNPKRSLWKFPQKIQLRNRLRSQ